MIYEHRRDLAIINQIAQPAIRCRNLYKILSKKQQGEVIRLITKERMSDINARTFADTNRERQRLFKGIFEAPNYKQFISDDSNSYIVIIDAFEAVEVIMRNHLKMDKKVVNDYPEYFI